MTDLIAQYRAHLMARNPHASAESIERYVAVFAARQPATAEPATVKRYCLVKVRPWETDPIFVVRDTLAEIETAREIFAGYAGVVDVCTVYVDAPRYTTEAKEQAAEQVKAIFGYNKVNGECYPQDFGFNSDGTLIVEPIPVVVSWDFEVVAPDMVIRNVNVNLTESEQVAAFGRNLNELAQDAGLQGARKAAKDWATSVGRPFVYASSETDAYYYKVARLAAFRGEAC